MSDRAKSVAIQMILAGVCVALLATSSAVGVATAGAAVALWSLGLARDWDGFRGGRRFGTAEDDDRTLRIVGYSGVILGVIWAATAVAIAVL